MNNLPDLEAAKPDPAAILAIAQSLWEACQTQAARDPKINLSEAYSGMDQFMRELMRVASLFESWSCRFIDFPELDEPWPYLLQDRFGDACLNFRTVAELAAFAEPDCLRVALRLRLPVKRDQGLPVPVDMRADLPSRDGMSGFRAFRIQTIRDELPGPQCAAFTWDDDPYDPAFSPPFFGLYGVNAAGLSEHIADRSTLTAALELAANLVPGVAFSEGCAKTSVQPNFGVCGHDRALGRDDMSSRSKSSDLSPHSQNVPAALAPKNSVHVTSPEQWNGFTIYLNTLFQGPVPVLTGEGDSYIVFKTEEEAQKEIVEHAIIRLRQFLADDRDYQDAITVVEYIVPVTVFPDGSFTDEDGNVFGPKSRLALPDK